MQENLKIGLGIILGFAMLGALVFLSINSSTNGGQKTVLETNNVQLKTDGSIYTAYIKKLPETAKQEVYLWMRNERGLGVGEVCDKIVIFNFSDTISEQKKELFDPGFEACKL